MKEKRDFMQMEGMIGNVSMSEGDNQDFQFEHIEKEKVLQNIGGIIFVSLLMILGIGGNLIAIFVYLQKYKQSSYRTFIVTLSIVDLATCCAPMIFIILTLRYPINFFNDWTCKLRTFLIYSMCIGSSLILVTIAVERYRKICIPFGIQLSASMSKYICILDIVLGIALSWPAAIFYGNKPVKNGVNQTVGGECDVSDDFADTNYPVYFNIILLFIVFATMIVLSITYAFIGKQIFRLKKKNSKKRPNHISQDDLVTTEFSPSECSSRKEESKEEKVRNIYDDRSNISAISFKANGQEKQSTDSKGKTPVFSEGGPNQHENESKQNKTVAITLVFFIIAVVYCCSFLPHFALRLAGILDKNFVQNLSFAGTVVYQTFRWTFFINNMANPIIYGLYDRKFMREVRMLCRSCLGICLKIKLKTKW